MIDRLHYISPLNSQLKAIEMVLLAGGKWIQLRVKNQTEDEVLALAIEAVALCKKHGAKLIINDYPLVALKAGADGVHLGLDDMPIAEARTILGPEMIIGGTANTLVHIQLRVDEGADYIGLGPYRFTSTKKNLSPIIGLEGYVSLMKQAKDIGIKTPVIAIGGIETTDISALIAAGVYGIAISGALTTNPEHTPVIQNLVHFLLRNSEQSLNLT